MGNPFETLGLPARFDLDEADLHKRFIRLSSDHHPDRYTDALDQADAAERSAVVNEAYRALRDPESRANALLAVMGGPAIGDDKELPEGFLLEVMEVRERMDEVLAEGDHAAVDELTRWVEAERGARLKAVGELFIKAGGQGGETRAAALRDIRRELNALRYFERMAERLRA
ncbi:MAG: Fe-S protein assembly co-chaperone HscB [Planctomycetes bacterium]|nr:Fe-S protein assembly co-chaperone HscB [Planctomycetota bacterium]